MKARALLLCAAIATLMLTAPAHAEDAPWGEDVAVMVDSEMDDARGGFLIQGMEINFGAVVTTYVDGVQALRTTLTWTEAGALIQQTLGQTGQSIRDLSPEALAALGLDTLPGAGGVVIQDANGVTALVHNVSEDGLQNIVINDASGRDLRQEIAVTLELPGFEAIQQQLLLERFGMRLTEDMAGLNLGPGS